MSQPAERAMVPPLPAPREGHWLMVAIVGSWEYPNLDEVRRFVNELPADCQVVSGGARGVDRTAEDAARERGMPAPLIFKPDYDRYGRHEAPKIRNQRIAEECDVMFAFWDGSSTGTLDALSRAKSLGKPRYRRTGHKKDPLPHDLSREEREGV